MTIGFVGLGQQGTPIAGRIADHFPLTVWARRPEACAKVPGAAIAETLEDLGHRCSIVGICVRDDKDVRSVAPQISAGMAPGGILIVHSTVLPETLTDLAHQLAERGIAVVDAPVSGGPVRAQRGEMVVMVGASPADFQVVLPILQTFANLVEHLGGIGSGQRMKLINNGLFFANASAAAAAIHLAREMDIDPAAAGRILLAGTGRSTALELLDIAGAGLERLGRSPVVRKDINHLAEISAGKSKSAGWLVDAAKRLSDYSG